MLALARLLMGEREEVWAWLGEALGMRNARGAVVTAVAPDGPAAHAGIIAGDIIVSMGDQQHRSRGGEDDGGRRTQRQSPRRDL